MGIARRSAAGAHLQAMITVTTPHGHQQRHSPHSPSPGRLGKKFETAVILLLFPEHAVGRGLRHGASPARERPAGGAPSVSTATSTTTKAASATTTSPAERCAEDVQEVLTRGPSLVRHPSWLGLQRWRLPPCPFDWLTSAAAQHPAVQQYRHHRLGHRHHLLRDGRPLVRPVG